MDPLDSVCKLMQFSEEVGHLKDTARRGWLLRGVPQPESVADHMYRMAMFSLVLKPIPNCDMGKVMRMCLVHDLAECRVGDITPDDGIAPDEKHRMERQAITGLSQLLDPDIGSALVDLYHEYEQHESLEAKVTKDLDIFDFVHQAFVYEKKAAAAGSAPSSLRLESFFRTADSIREPQLKQLADRLLEDRRLFLLKHESAAANAGDESAPASVHSKPTEGQD